MIKEQHSNEQLPNELSSVFSELQVSKHLRQAGIRKSFGFSCAYLFQLVFCLIFHQKNWFALVISKKNDCFPGKDTVYRFLNHSKFAWRKFLLRFRNKKSYVFTASVGISKCSSKRRSHSFAYKKSSKGALMTYSLVIQRSSLLDTSFSRGKIVATQMNIH